MTDLADALFPFFGVRRKRRRRAEAAEARAERAEGIAAGKICNCVPLVKELQLKVIDAEARAERAERERDSYRELRSLALADHEKDIATLARTLAEFDTNRRKDGA